MASAAPADLGTRINVDDLVIGNEYYAYISENGSYTKWRLAEKEIWKTPRIRWTPKFTLRFMGNSLSRLDFTAYEVWSNHPDDYPNSVIFYNIIGSVPPENGYIVKYDGRSSEITAFIFNKPEDLGPPISYETLNIGDEFYWLNYTSRQFVKVTLINKQKDAGWGFRLSVRETETGGMHQLGLKEGASTEQQTNKFFSINAGWARRRLLIQAFNAKKHEPRTMGGRRRFSSHSRKRSYHRRFRKSRK
jgi:hypothetical protein